MPQPVKRMLAAIMFTDIIGYTAMMQQSESEAIEIRKKHREIFNPVTEQFGGRIMQYFGDGTLSIFKSSLDAVKCGIELQRGFLSPPSIPVRMGIHSGDIAYNQEEIIGDSVNVASRLESLAIGGSLLVSGKIYQEIRNHGEIQFHYLGKVLLKNIVQPLSVYSVVNPPLKIPSLDDLGTKGRIRPKTLAVLPFLNIGNKEEDEFFCDGITEEILNIVAKVGALQVTSRTSSFYFKKKQLPIQEIGKMLNVSYILEGSIRRVDNRVRITVQLIQTKDDYQIWSHRYDRSIDDIFALQDEIATVISKKLLEELGVTVKASIRPQEVNEDAHNAYLKGVYYFNKWSPDAVRKSISAFHDALEYEEDYGAAFAGLASCYVFLGITGQDPLSLELAREAAAKSYELDPENEDCILAQAVVKSLLDKDEIAADRLFNRALEINPDYARAHHYYGMHLAQMDRLEQSLVEYARAAELDPLSLPISSEYAFALCAMGRYEKALKQVSHTLSLDKDFRAAWETKGWIYFSMGDFESALEAFKTYQSMTDAPDKGLSGLASTTARLGDVETARHYLDLLEKRQASNPGMNMNIDLAMIYMGLGDEERAMDLIEKGLLMGQGSHFLNYLPIFQPLRGHPRYEAIRKQYLPSPRGQI